MQSVGAGVDAVLDELLDAQVVGRFLALNEVLALQNKVDNRIAGAGVEEVWVLLVVQVQVVAAELEVNAALSLREECRVQLHGTEQTTTHPREAGLELVRGLGEDLLLAWNGF